MFERWDNFFVLIGTAAGGLIGLLFVVVTLTSERVDRDRALRASGIYMTPNLVHFAVALVASALVLAPLSPQLMAAVLAGAALAGLANAVRASRGIAAFQRESASSPHWSDLPLYGVAPGVLYVGLLGVAAAIWLGADFAPYALAALLMILMLLAIRNAWDLITWIAPGLPAGANPPPPAG